ncbi:MAG: hypothetical protein A4E62_02332 [Syntrophorhabdus sp. PtaU1.Bin002]|nr:MAG: hypothetical protein A4E62_02332 [Syntrophorhabdus sp. PtaU1.Bin002]
MEGILHGPGRYKKVSLTLFFGNNKTVSTPCTPEGACNQAHLLGQTISIVLKTYDRTLPGKAFDETFEGVFLLRGEAEYSGQFFKGKRSFFSLEDVEKHVFGDVRRVLSVFHIPKETTFSSPIGRQSAVRICGLSIL